VRPTDGEGFIIPTDDAILRMKEIIYNMMKEFPRGN
jgi:hypothetical protein